MPTAYIFNNAIKEMVLGTMKFDGSVAYKLALVGTTSTYTVNKDNATWNAMYTAGLREPSGATGYTAGGSSAAGSGAASVTPTVTLNASPTNTVTIAFSSASWAASTISAKGAVLIRASDSVPVLYIDFGSTISSSSSTLTVNFSSPLTLAM